MADAAISQLQPANSARPLFFAQFPIDHVVLFAEPEGELVSGLNTGWAFLDGLSEVRRAVRARKHPTECVDETRHALLLRR